MKIIIDGVNIESAPGNSVLDAALQGGIYIPHLCKHPDLEAIGGCRLCMVEVNGITEAVPACKTEVFDGMEVSVHSPKAEKVRKMAMELILASHPADCTGCPKYGKCELQSMYQYIGVGPERWRKKSRTVPNNDANPLIQHLFTRCIRCGRCIRACRELRGVGILDYQRTKDGIRAGTENNQSLIEAGCRFCGACIEVCPTGSIMDALGILPDNVAYGDAVVPCRSACPAGIDIPRYIRCISNGDFSAAAAVIREYVPFPETLGNICTHICENSCKRSHLNEPLSICRLKKAAAFYDDGTWQKQLRQDPPTGKSVAVIGAGPAGLTAAYYLAKKGHAVTVYEENEKPGGQCRYGIPAYRLPDEILDREIAAILETGVRLQTKITVKSPSALLEKNDAVLVAIGAHEGTKLPIAGKDLNGVLVNTQFLKSVRQGVPLPIGERVIVLGGGNVAFDCARTAIRLGAKEVSIACLEKRSEMPASSEEIQEGLEEGIQIYDGYAFVEIIGTDWVESIKLHKITGFSFEDDKTVIDSANKGDEIIPIDTVIFAVGQKPAHTRNMGLELIKGVYIKSNDNMETTIPGIFAAGDAVTGAKSVIEAIAAGRKSAQAIDCFLGGDGNFSENLADTEKPSPFLGPSPDFALLERKYPELISPSERQSTFIPIEEPYDKITAQQEAKRCLQCDLRLMLTPPKLWHEYQKGGKE